MPLRISHPWKLPPLHANNGKHNRTSLSNYIGRTKTLLAWFLLGAWLATFAASPGAFAQETSAEQRRAKLEELKASIAKLQAQLNTVKDNRDTLLNKLESEEKRIGELNKKVEKLQKALDEKKNNLQSLREERHQSRIARNSQQKQVSQHVNSAYRLGKQSSVKLILNQTNPAKVSRNLKYFDYIIKDRARHIAEYTATVNTLNQLEPKIQAETKALKQNHESLRNKQQELQTAQSERKRTLKTLETAIANKDKELKSLEQNRKHLESLVQRVVRVMGELEAPVKNQKLGKLKGQLPWPVKGPVRHSYGSSRVEGKVRWQGMMIGANHGTNVKAIHHGRVVFSDYLRGYGLLIIIDHGEGFLSLYAHNAALFKTLGEWVDTRDIIATVGDTGGQNQAGLYFELRHNGSPTNPHRWLTRKR